jgi:hypothetical protein
MNCQAETITIDDENSDIKSENAWARKS